MEYLTFAEASKIVNLKPSTLRFLASQGLKTVVVGGGKKNIYRVTTKEWIDDYMKKNASDKIVVRTNNTNNLRITNKDPYADIAKKYGVE